MANLVTCGFAGSLTNRALTLSIPGQAVWTEALAVPGTTTNVAPAATGGAGDPVFTVCLDVDAIISIGPNPNATTGPRYKVFANVERTFYAQPGDKLAIAAVV